MSEPIAILPIVEGHGEVEAVGILLRRLGDELCGRTIIVPRPIRVPRNRLEQEQHLSKAIGLALLKLADVRVARHSVLVLLDSDGDAPCDLGPRLQSIAAKVRSDADIFPVVAHLEYETWFAAAARSLAQCGEIEIAEDGAFPQSPEAQGLRKAWIRAHIKDRPGGYSETLDQPRLTTKMDLQECRENSPSFDKLCREVESRCVADGLAEA